MQTIKTKSGKTYTKKQICEAVAYWKKQLKLGNYKRLNESLDNYLTVNDLTNIVSKYKNLKSFKIKGYADNKVVYDGVVGGFGFSSYAVSIFINKNQDLQSAANDAFYRPSIQHLIGRISSLGLNKDYIALLYLRYGDTPWSSDNAGYYFATNARMQNDTLVLQLDKASPSQVDYLKKKHDIYMDDIYSDKERQADLKVQRYLKYPLAIFSSIDDTFWWGAFSKHKDDVTIKKAIKTCTDMHDDEYRQVYVDPVSKQLVSCDNLNYDYIVKMLKSKGEVSIPCGTYDPSDEENRPQSIDDCASKWIIRFATKDDIEYLVNNQNAFNIIK